MLNMIGMSSRRGHFGKGSKLFSTDIQDLKQVKNVLNEEWLEGIILHIKFTLTEQARQG